MTSKEPSLRPKKVSDEENLRDRNIANNKQLVRINRTLVNLRTELAELETFLETINVHNHSESTTMVEKISHIRTMHDSEVIETFRRILIRSTILDSMTSLELEISKKEKQCESLLSDIYINELWISNLSNINLSNGK